MSIKQLARRMALTIGALLAGAGVVAAQEVSSLGEVVVTAQKRAETLVEIPMSISVIGGETLERGQADNFQDLVALVPGLSINTNTPGVSRITLRGTNTGGVASTVGVYVNDVPFGSSSGLANGAILSGDFDTFDMERIEVLRGPAGNALRRELTRRRDQVRRQRAVDSKDFEGRLQGRVERRRRRRPGLCLDRRAQHSRRAIRSRSAPAASIVPMTASSTRSATTRFRPCTIPTVNIVEDTGREESQRRSTPTVDGCRPCSSPPTSFSLNLTALYQKIEQRLMRTGLEGRPGHATSPCTAAPWSPAITRSSTDIEYQRLQRNDQLGFRCRHPPIDVPAMVSSRKASSGTWPPARSWSTDCAAGTLVFSTPGSTTLALRDPASGHADR